MQSRLCTCIDYLFSWISVSVHPQHVLRDPPVMVGVHLVKDNKDHVKTGEERVLHAYVVHWGLVLIILKKKKKGHIIAVIVLSISLWGAKNIRRGTSKFCIRSPLDSKHAYIIL